VNTGAYGLRPPRARVAPASESVQLHVHGMASWNRGSEWERIGAASGSADFPWYVQTRAYALARITSSAPAVYASGKAHADTLRTRRLRPHANGYAQLPLEFAP